MIDDYLKKLQRDMASHSALSIANKTGINRNLIAKLKSGDDVNTTIRTLRKIEQAIS